MPPLLRCQGPAGQLCMGGPRRPGQGALSTGFGAWRGRADWFPARRWAGWVQVPAAQALRTQPVESARLDGLFHQEPVGTQPRAGGLRVLGWYLIQHLQLRQEAPHLSTVVVLGGFLQRWAAVGGARWRPSSDSAQRRSLCQPRPTTDPIPADVGGACLQAPSLTPYKDGGL